MQSTCRLSFRPVYPAGIVFVRCLAEDNSLTVFAAASRRTRSTMSTPPIQPRPPFKSSLAPRQFGAWSSRSSGAPADIFVSRRHDWRLCNSARRRSTSDAVNLLGKNQHRPLSRQMISQNRQVTIDRASIFQNSPAAARSHRRCPSGAGRKLPGRLLEKLGAWTRRPSQFS